MNPFVRNVALVLRGTIVAQGIIVLLTPVLTRLFPPEAFAVAQSFASIMSLMLIVGSLRYDVVITVVEDENVSSLLCICLAFSLLTAVACGLVVGLGPGLAPASWRFRQFEGLGVVAFIGAASVSVTNAFSMIMIRDHRFAILANSKIRQSAVYIVVALLIGWLAASRTGLVIADLPGRFVAALFLAMAALGRLGIAGPLASWTRVKALLKRYRHFSIVSLPAGFLATLSGSFNTIWMLAIFDVRTAGLYAIVERGISMPMGVLGNAVAQVYQGQLSRSIRTSPERAAGEFRRLLMSQVKIALVPTVMLMLLARPLIPIVLGEPWREAGVFCQILMPYFFVSFVATPFSSALLLLERQRHQLGWELFRFALMMGSWFLAYELKISPRRTLIGISASGCVVYLVYLGVAYSQILRAAAGRRSVSRV